MFQTLIVASSSVVAKLV